MTDQTEIVLIKLLDREYQIKCPHDREADLLEAANYLDAKMRSVTDGEKLVNVDRIFMIAALNLANELVNLKRQNHLYIANINERIHALQHKIEDALAE